MPPRRGHQKPRSLQGKYPGVLTDKQKLFIQAYLANPDKKAAAMAAGVPDHSAGSMGSQWLNPELFPHVAAAVQRAFEEREMRSEKKASDILQYIQTAMYFEPLKYFTSSDGQGGWMIDLEGFRNLPPFIGCLIESFEHVFLPVKGEDGEIEYKTQVKVRLVSKTKAMELAAKHQLGELHRVASVSTTIPWDELYKRSQEICDPIEERIKRVEGEVKDGPAPLPNGLKELPPSKPNGTVEQP